MRQAPWRLQDRRSTRGAPSRDAQLTRISRFNNSTRWLDFRGALHAYDAWLGLLRTDFGDRLLPITDVIAVEWGRLNARRTLPVVDGLMAATARLHGLTVVSRNAADFRRAGVPVLDPFE